jgi:hypothetical protein
MTVETRYFNGSFASPADSRQFETTNEGLLVSDTIVDGLGSQFWGTFADMYLRIAKGEPPQTFNTLTFLQDLYLGTLLIDLDTIKNYEITPNISEATLGANEEFYVWMWCTLQLTGYSYSSTYGHRTSNFGGNVIDAHTPTIRCSARSWFNPVTGFEIDSRFDNQSGAWGAYWQNFTWHKPTPEVPPKVYGDGLTWVSFLKNPLPRRKLRFPLLNPLKI